MAISKCGACKHTFLSLAGFDAHRKGGQCVDPAVLGMVLRDGTWRTPMTQAARERIRDIESIRNAAGGES